MLTLRAIVSGKVQGVFFRASTQKKAKTLGVTGYAKNLPNGDVEVVAYGEKQAVEALVQWLWEGPPRAQVLKVDYEEIESEKFSDFIIKK